jgi:hypothetical protein
MQINPTFFFFTRNTCNQIAAGIKVVKRLHLGTYHSSRPATLCKRRKLFLAWLASSGVPCSCACKKNAVMIAAAKDQAAKTSESFKIVVPLLYDRGLAVMDADSGWARCVLLIFCA